MSDQPSDNAAIVGAAPPPPGIFPSFDHPEYSGQPVVVANIACLALATSVCALRLFTKLKIVRTVDYSDYLIAPAWISAAAFASVNIIQCSYGLGVHMWNVPIVKFSPTFLQLQITTQALYCVSMMFTKLSFLAVYLRISPSRRFRAVVCLLMAVVAGYSFSAVLVAIFQCHPVEMAWDITISDGSCIDRMAYFIAILALNVTTDLFMLVLPIPMLWKVKMPKRQKLGLIGIFMTGSFVCVVGFLRIKSLVSLMGLNDLTWHLVDGYVWVVIEMNTGIICACLPFMKPFLKQVFPRVFGSSLGSSYRQSSTGQSRAVTLQGHVMELDNKITKTKSCTENLPTGGQGADLRSESQERIFNRPQDCDSVTTDASLPGPTGGSQDVVGQPRDLESAMD
ncbi:hypothetical protein FOQG_18886 [Fusarium oxysporum f. sp. raphani 54005]|uniref:Rhodopsin domain-containing protein n=1 Tax=Fusarium oxysporum f. sp. raphani 54005 TaxID=1089458 RepID=X0C0N7_FUSOX|nr:hypothetical protein FOQG_18886 [Fusarium oxysporum f. sp. raphani 54005]